MHVLWDGDVWTSYNVHDIVCTLIGVLHKETEWRIHLGSEVELETPNELAEESDEEEEAMRTEEQVQKAVNHLSSACDVEVQLRPCDQMEEELVAQFASAGCGCSKKCSHQFSLGYIRDMRAQCYDLTHSLTHNELDMVILGQLAAATNTSEKVTWKGKDINPIQLSNHAGKAVCGKTFWLSTHNREQKAEKPSQKLKGEWAHTTHTRQHTQMTQKLTAYRGK